jgi:CubicO group peptidase (beta-lactamase class C family)
MVHSLHSLTKTYAATAVCLAVDEGLVRLEDRLIDLFPEDAPAEISENLAMLTVKDVLCMGCGMETMPKPSEHWIRDFLAVPVVHKPGTVFMYNSMGSNMLGAIVKRVSGQGLHAFLKPRLFDKIGIDGDKFKWMLLPDGLEVGGGGGFATTEDNARLMMLYLQNGLWDGERVLSEEMVKMATSLQMDTSTNVEGIPDCRLGYGFQIWMCHPEGAYRADGALGQYSIVFPNLDMVVSINESAPYPNVVQDVLDIVYDVLLPEVADGPLPEDPEAFAELAHRLAGLAIPRPPYSPYSSYIDKINGKRFLVREGDIPWIADYRMMVAGTPERVTAFRLDFEPGACKITFDVENKPFEVAVGINGNGVTSTVKTKWPFSQVYTAGWWEHDAKLILQFRWLETCIIKQVAIEFADGEAAVTTSNRKVGVFDPPDVHARAVMA